MTKRKYHVETWGTSEPKRTTEFKVLDRYKNETEADRATIAIFPVGLGTDLNEQRVRANKFVEYLSDAAERLDVIDALTKASF